MDNKYYQEGRNNFARYKSDNPGFSSFPELYGGSGRFYSLDIDDREQLMKGYDDAKADYIKERKDKFLVAMVSLAEKHSVSFETGIDGWCFYLNIDGEEFEI